MVRSVPTASRIWRSFSVSRDVGPVGAEGIEGAGLVAVDEERHGSCVIAQSDGRAEQAGAEPLDLERGVHRVQVGDQGRDVHRLGRGP